MIIIVIVIKANYHGWDENQPSGQTENCAVQHDTGKWHDYPCDSIFYFVCQMASKCIESSVGVGITGVSINWGHLWGIPLLLYIFTWLNNHFNHHIHTHDNYSHNYDH